MKPNLYNSSHIESQPKILKYISESSSKKSSISDKQQEKKSILLLWSWVADSNSLKSMNKTWYTGKLQSVNSNNSFLQIKFQLIDNDKSYSA